MKISVGKRLFYFCLFLLSWIGVLLCGQMLIGRRGVFASPDVRDIAFFVISGVGLAVGSNVLMLFQSKRSWRVLMVVCAVSALGTMRTFFPGSNHSGWPSVLSFVASLLLFWLLRGDVEDWEATEHVAFRKKQHER